MDVPLSMMRMSLKQIYDSPDWSARVDRMHRNQVTAIYLRYKECRFNAERFKRKREHDATLNEQCKLQHCAYHCNACKAAFVRDNPELTECEFCGSSNIEKECIS